MLWSSARKSFAAVWWRRNCSCHVYSAVRYQLLRLRVACKSRTLLARSGQCRPCHSVHYHHERWFTVLSGAPPCFAFVSTFRAVTRVAISVAFYLQSVLFIERCTCVRVLVCDRCRCHATIAGLPQRETIDPSLCYPLQMATGQYYFVTPEVIRSRKLDFARDSKHASGKHSIKMRICMCFLIICNWCFDDPRSVI